MARHKSRTMVTKTQFRPSDVCLAEVIKHLPNDRVLYIGSLVGWMFIGTKKEFERKADLVFAYYKEKTVELMKRIDCDIKHCGKGRDDLRNRYEAYKNNVAIKSKLCIPFKDRRVCIVYEHKRAPGTAIIVEGKEAATSWTMEEYKKWESINLQQEKLDTELPIEVLKNTSRTMGYQLKNFQSSAK